VLSLFRLLSSDAGTGPQQWVGWTAELVRACIQRRRAGYCWIGGVLRLSELGGLRGGRIIELKQYSLTARAAEARLSCDPLVVV